MSEVEAPKNDADKCRANGWKVGDRLAGDEGYGESVILLTAIGLRNILAVCISHAGNPNCGIEQMWTLSCREWRKL